MEMQQNKQRELLSNPDMLRQMMDSPLVQSLMTNPDYMRHILTSNPQMQQLLEVCYLLNYYCCCLLTCIYTAPSRNKSCPKQSRVVKTDDGNCPKSCYAPGINAQSG